jgi:hypothetical protein
MAIDDQGMMKPLASLAVYYYLLNINFKTMYIQRAWLTFYLYCIVQSGREGDQ